MYVIPSDFSRFIAPDCNRMEFIQKKLNAAGLDTAVFALEGKNHIYVKFPQSQYNPMFKIKTVIAHYDRFEGSPGANDNSAAVFCLMEWAVTLARKPGFHNVRLIFTDGEELGEGGVNEQGAFALAREFKKLGLTRDDVFVFDSMGRGDVPVICENDFSSKVPATLVNRILDLENAAEKILKEASGGKWFKLKTAYSDNASFIVNGIPAIAITMLPSSEVSFALKGEEPLTWKLFHTRNDNLASLDSAAFELFFKILNNLAAYRVLV